MRKSEKRFLKFIRMEIKRSSSSRQYVRQASAKDEVREENELLKPENELEYDMEESDATALQRSLSSSYHNVLLLSACIHRLCFSLLWLRRAYTCPIPGLFFGKRLTETQCIHGLCPGFTVGFAGTASESDSHRRE